MKPTRATTVGAVFAGGLVAGYLFAVLLYRDLPRLPRTSFVTFFVLGVVELYLAMSVRARLLGRPGTKPIIPIVVARMAALAKASTAVGAAGAGAWVGLMAYTLQRQQDFRYTGSDAVTASLATTASVLLLVAAWRLERACTPPVARDAPPPAEPGP